MKRAFVGLVMIAATAAHADPPTRRHLLHHAAITAGGALAIVLSEKVFKDDLAPATCRWCEPLAFDGAMRDALVWRDTGRADWMSYTTVGGVAAVGVAELRSSDDALDLAESALAAVTAGQIAKFTVGRERPFVHFAAPGRVHENDDDVSFFSSHTALAFSLATTAGVLASRHHDRLAPWIWGGGMTLAAATGYLRIAADRHWTTDVLVGAAAGAAAGWLVPKLHEHDLSVVPTASGVALTGTF
jgi:membrane-associated phospholipid phosphatase